GEVRRERRHGVRHVPGLGVLGPCPSQQCQRDLGQIVRNEVVQLLVAQDLCHGGLGVPPERCPAPNVNSSFHTYQTFSRTGTLSHFRSIGSAQRAHWDRVLT